MVFSEDEEERLSSIFKEHEDKKGHERRMEDILRLAYRLDSHEQVCALRQKQILERMGRLERIAISVAAAIILALLSSLSGVVWWVIVNRTHVETTSSLHRDEGQKDRPALSRPMSYDPRFFHPRTGLAYRTYGSGGDGPARDAFRTDYLVCARQPSGDS